MNSIERLGVWLSVALFMFTVEVEGQVADSLIQRADSLFQKHAVEKSLQEYNRIIEKDSTYFPAYWRLSLLNARLGFDSDDEEQSREYYERALNRANRALALRPGHPEAHFAKGVAMGRKALISGPRDRLNAAREIKHHAEQALKADTNHHGAHHLLGRWHLEVTDLNFAERLAANWLLGGIPEGASMDRALKHLERAVELETIFIVYWLDLGKAYYRLERREQALKALEKAMTKPLLWESEEVYRKEARKLYQELK